MIIKSYIVEENISYLSKNLYLFYGENFGLIEDIKKTIIIENPKSEIIKLDQEYILKNKEKFYSLLFNISLFERKRILMVSNVNDYLLDTLQEIEKKIQDQKIYFFSGIMDKRSKLRNYFEKSKTVDCVPCYADNEITFRKIIQKKLFSFKGVSAENLNLIIESSNLNRVKLNNELDKIINFFDDKTIVRNKLEKLLNEKENEDFNNLRDEALVGNKKKTNDLISNTLMENEKNTLYLNLITQRLSKLKEANILTKKNNHETAVEQLKPPIFWKDKTMFINQLKKWDDKKIIKILNKAYTIEKNIKSSSQINHQTVLRKFIIDICNLANS